MPEFHSVPQIDFANAGGWDLPGRCMISIEVSPVCCCLIIILPAHLAYCVSSEATKPPCSRLPLASLAGTLKGPGTALELSPNHFWCIR